MPSLPDLPTVLASLSEPETPPATTSQYNTDIRSHHQKQALDQDLESRSQHRFSSCMSDTTTTGGEGSCLSLKRL